MVSCSKCGANLSVPSATKVESGIRFCFFCGQEVEGQVGRPEPIDWSATVRITSVVVIICIILATTAKFLSESGMAMHRNLNRKLAAGFQGGFEDQLVRQGGRMSLAEIVDPKNLDEAYRLRSQQIEQEDRAEKYRADRARDQRQMEAESQDRRQPEIRPRREAPPQASSNPSRRFDRETTPQISQLDQEIQDNLREYRGLQPSAKTDSRARGRCTYLLMKLRGLADSSDDQQLKQRVAYAITRQKTYGDFIRL
ncbi:hypothetical protein EBR66_06200 [bacterium]|nr:hypothetical protein [bacterium]